MDATGKGVTFVVNPAAGSESTDTTALRAGLADVTIVELDEPSALEESLRIAAEDAEVIGVVGGDGSINTAAGVAVETERKLAIVPGGTLNHLARDLGIADVDATIAALRADTVTMLDIGLIDDHVFLNTASFGSYAELVDAREALEDRIGKWPAFALATLRVLARAKPVTVELDGKRRRIWTIFIGNCSYQPTGFAPTRRERLDDGLLDIRVVDADPPLARLRLLFALLVGRLAKSAIYDEWTAPSMHVRSLDGPLRLARDGETFDGAAEFEVKKASAPLAVYAPTR